MTTVTLFDFVEAYEAYEGDNVGAFIQAWETYLSGTDFPCSGIRDGMHRVTDGSCDECGDKNRDG